MNWKRALIATCVAVPIIALLALGFKQDPKEIPSPLPGHQAPLFSLPVFAPGERPLSLPIGDTVRLGDFRGQVVVLNFWASWCGPCRQEHPALTEVAQRYAGRPVRFIGVLYNDSLPSARAWIGEMGGEAYPSLDDPGARTAVDFGVYGVPETYFIDRTGRVAAKQTGPVTDETLTHVVDSLLAVTPAMVSTQ